MNRTLTLATASLISLGTAILAPSAAKAEVDCVNYWINPENRMLQCFDGELNYIDTPFSYFQANNFAGSMSRRNTTAEMIMPDLIGREIDVAEDFLLDLGVTLGSEAVYAQNRFVGEVVQQTPAAGTVLVEGQTVLLEYMGAAVAPQEIKMK